MITQKCSSNFLSFDQGAVPQETLVAACVGPIRGVHRCFLSEGVVGKRTSTGRTNERYGLSDVTQRMNGEVYGMVRVEESEYIADLNETVAKDDEKVDQFAGWMAIDHIEDAHASLRKSLSSIPGFKV